MIKNLYDFPEVYSRVFPVDEEDLNFFAAMGAECGGPILDAGAGTGALAAGIAAAGGHEVVALDLSRILLRGARNGCAGDLFALPFRDASFRFAYSRLFGYAYACAQNIAECGLLARELGRVVKSGAKIAIEVPLAYQPKRLQGIREQAVLDAATYEFRYLDLLRSGDHGAILDTSITVQAEGDTCMLKVPIHVFTPEGAAAWLAQGGFVVESFYASYDLRSATHAPPKDCLRAVIVGKREIRE